MQTPRSRLLPQGSFGAGNDTAFSFRSAFARISSRSSFGAGPVTRLDTEEQLLVVACDSHRDTWRVCPAFLRFLHHFESTQNTEE